jgi:hypothetical protein
MPKTKEEKAANSYASFLQIELPGARGFIMRGKFLSELYPSYVYSLSYPYPIPLMSIDVS